MPIKIGVTEPEYGKAKHIFTQALERGCHCLPLAADEERLAEEVAQGRIQHVIVGVSRYGGGLYQSLPQRAVIARFGVGHDGIDKSLATEHRLLCTNTPGVLDDSVAEHAFGMLLTLARQSSLLAARMAAGEWSPRMGIEVAGKTLAVIGCGRIGCRLARIATRGFGLKAVGLRKQAAPAQHLCEAFGFDRIVTDFAEAVHDADFVSLHLPGGPETLHYLNSSRLAQLPDGCLLINTARGSVVDEVALFDALEHGPISAAALDVFETEPYQPRAKQKDLRCLPNVIMTPHIGSSTREACERMAARALWNIQLATEKRYAEMDLLNPAVLPLLHVDSSDRS
ncbi:MAG: NAD(P)-dependent oxidoreductase [Verrucomicrobiota bacterium]